MFDKNVEEFYSDKITEKMLKKKKKILGIHEPPTIENTDHVSAGSDANSNLNRTFSVDGLSDVADDALYEDDEYRPPAGAETAFPQDNVRRPHLEDLEDTGSPIYIELPGYLEGLAPSKKIMYNIGDGLCLFRSVAQQENFDPKELKRYTNKKLVEWFPHFKTYFPPSSYPMHIRVGSGYGSYGKKINHQHELF